MRTPTLLWRTFGSAVAVLILGWSVFGAVSVLAQHHEQIDVSVDAEGIAVVEIEIDFAKVEIVGTESARISVHATTRSGLFEIEHREQRDRDRFVVSQACRQNRGPLWIPRLSCSSDYRIEVPEGVEVRFRGGNSEVALSQLEGKVDVVTSNQRISASSLTGWTKLQTSNDEIDARGLGRGPVDLHTSNDSVRAEFSESPREVSIRTSNDSVSLVLPENRTSYAVDVKTSNGERNVGIRTDPDSHRRIKIRTSNDDITVAYGSG